MTDRFLLSGMALGLVMVLAYVGQMFIGRTTRRPMLADAAVLFLASNGLAAGAKTCFFAWGTTLMVLENERAYVFLGGLAVIWVSIQTIAGAFARSRVARSQIHDRSDNASKVC